VEEKRQSNVFTVLGVRPFINCTATFTINGGSLMLPEVIEAMEQAAHFHVNLDELMEKVGDRIAELLQVDWAVVTGGCAAALVSATSACIVGTDPEKMQRLPSLEGLQSEVIVPRESRHVYDQAIRSVGVRIVEVDSLEELRAAISAKTAMIAIFGNHFGDQSMSLAITGVSEVARTAGVPLFVDAAADYPLVPNPYLSAGADLVAYSGGKILRGPQNAGLLLGRRDLVRAAWANSAPHHAIGRPSKASKESIIGMLRAVEIWRARRDIGDEFREWESWYHHIAATIRTIPGVTADIRGPARGGPFPVLQVAWDPEHIDLTADQVGRWLLSGEPRIMTHASGDGHSFLIRPAALRVGEYLIVAKQLHDVLSGAPRPAVKRPGPSAMNVSGCWDVEVRYQVGMSQHRFSLSLADRRVTGWHQGWMHRAEINGLLDGDRIELRSSFATEGTRLFYVFTGFIRDDHMGGRLDLGEYGEAKWEARRSQARWIE
jgi:L-seryl-tRNA(Ser) seleniumtransferase